MGTVREKSNFSGQKEAEILRKAMKGIGEWLQVVWSVLSQCQNQNGMQVSEINISKMFFASGILLLI